MADPALQAYASEEEKARQAAKQTNQEAYNKSLTSLGQYKDNALQMYATNQNQAQQGAYVGNEMLKKYLPQQQTAAGLGGLGVSQTAQLQANNNHMSTLGQINSNYDNMRRVTLQDYATKKAGVEDTLFERNRLADDEFKAAAVLAQEKSLGQTQSLLEMYRTNAMADGIFTDDEYNTILNDMDWSRVTEQDAKYLKEYLKQEWKAQATAAKSNDWSAYRDNFLNSQYIFEGDTPRVDSNGKLSVSVNGKVLSAKSNVSGDEILKNIAKYQKSEGTNWVNAALTGRVPDGAIMLVFDTNGFNRPIMYYNEKFYLLE